MKALNTLTQPTTKAWDQSRLRSFLNKKKAQSAWRTFAHPVYLHQTSIKQDRKLISYKVKKSPFLRDSLIQIPVELQEAWS